MLNDNFRNYRFTVIYEGDGVSMVRRHVFFLTKDENVAYVVGVTTIVNITDTSMKIRCISMDVLD